MAFNKNKKQLDPRIKASSQSTDIEVYEQNIEDDAVSELYSYNDDNSPITVASLKRSRKYLILGIILPILALLSVCAFIAYSNLVIVQEQNNCYSQEQYIEQIAEQYVVVNGFASYPAYIEDIPSVTELNLTCPSGGTYTWNPISGTYSCSEHGHYPSSFNQAISIEQGSTQLEIPQE